MTERRLDESKEAREEIIEELRDAKRMALDIKDIKALRQVNAALRQLGIDDVSLIDREIDLEVELDCIKTALYRHFDKDGNLLYIGVSLSAIERTIAHRNNSPWYKDIARIEFEWHHSRSAAYYHEKLAIQREKPKHNISHNSHARTS